MCSTLPWIRRPCWAPKRAPRGAYESHGDPSPGRAREHDIAGLNGLCRPFERGDRARVDGEHREVALLVDTDDGGLLDAAVGEGHRGGGVAQVVGVRQHLAGGDHDAGAPTVSSDRNHGRTDLLAYLLGRSADLIDHFHGGLS